MNLPSFSERKLQFIQVISQMTDPEEFSQLEALSQKYHKKDESFFWEMIDLLDWEQSDNELIIKPLIQVLSQKSLSEIFTFQEYLSQKLFFLDQKCFAQNFADQYFSVDTFLYVRACVVANGKAFYDHICQNPQEMPSDLTFESLLYVAQKAYQQQTGEHFMPYLPTVSYETYSNKIALVMKIHGNSLNSPNLHHLYEIIDLVRISNAEKSKSFFIFFIKKLNYF